MILNTTSLDAPRSALTSAREHLDKATAALARGRQHAADANAALERQAVADDAAATERASALAQAFAAGREAPSGFVASDAVARAAAVRNAEIAAEAVELLEAEHDQAEMAVTTADQELQSAIDLVLDARAVELMEQAETHLRALQEIAAELSELLPDHRFDAAPGLPSEAQARELLKRLPITPRSDFDTPINELRHGGARTSRLPELRAQLLAGEPAQIEQVAA